MFIYQEAVYNNKAPQEVVPYLNELFKPRSVLDVGCGTGTWLKMFTEFSNVQSIVGIDGEFEDKSHLVIPSESFYHFDLNRPFDLNKHFDLVLSLEVAEHLLRETADFFVESLIKHGDIIIFSAAIPRQGGQNHINEQWPEYWRQKFVKHGFQAYDILRPKFWNNENINWWYRQNMFIYAKEGSFTNEVKPLNDKIRPYVHPELFQSTWEESQKLKQLLDRKIKKPGLIESIYSLIKAIKLKFW